MESAGNILAKPAKSAGDVTYDVNAPIYKDKAEYVLTVPEAGKDSTGNIAMWAGDDAKLVTQAFGEGVTKMPIDLPAWKPPAFRVGGPLSLPNNSYLPLSAPCS